MNTPQKLPRLPAGSRKLINKIRKTTAQERTLGRKISAQRDKLEELEEQSDKLAQTRHTDTTALMALLSGAVPNEVVDQIIELL